MYLKPRFEYKLFRERNNPHLQIIGIDEVGRGSWAGPLVMSAYALNFSNFSSLTKYKAIKRVGDSKKTIKKFRELIYTSASAELEQGLCQLRIVERSAEEISVNGLKWAIDSSLQEIISGFGVENSLYLLDGGLRPQDPGVEYQTIIKGDAQIYSIAVAANFAKVYRDRLMQSYAQEYPHYNFHTNVGYATLVHRNALREHGVCPIHRRSFKPIKELLEIEAKR